MLTLASAQDQINYEQANYGQFSVNQNNQNQNQRQPDYMQMDAGQDSVNRLIDEAVCPRVSKFLDLISKNQLSMINVTALEHVENSNILLVGTESGDIELWDFQSKDIITRFGNNANSSSIKQIIYLTNFDKILVIYGHDLEISNQNQGKYSLIIWDPQTQKQVFSFPQQEQFPKKGNNVLGQKIIDINVEKTANGSNNNQMISEIRFIIITDTSFITCTLNKSMQASCQADIFNTNFIKSNPLNVFITSQNKYVIFNQEGLIEYNSEKRTYLALLVIKDGTFSQCLFYPSLQKYVFLKEKGNAIYIFDMDSQKEYLKKLIELNSIKLFVDAQKVKHNKNILLLNKLIKIENYQPVLFALFNDGTLLHINYEDDKILEEFQIQNPKLIVPLKSSPSFFVAQENGSISFYRQTTFQGTTNLQLYNPFSQVNELRRQMSTSTNLLPDTENILSKQQNYVAEVVQNNFKIYHLTFQSANVINSQSINLVSNQEISDYLVNFNSKIVYFYESTASTLYICTIQDLKNCIKKKLEINNLNSESYEFKMKKVIHYHPEGGILVINNMNSIYIYSIKEGENIPLNDHLTQVFMQKFLTRSQSPMMINLLKQRYNNSFDSTFLFICDGNKISVFEYIHSQKKLNNIYSKTFTKPNDKVVGIELLQEEQLIMFQFINNTYQFYDLKKNQLLKDIVELEQHNNQFVNYDFFLQLDLRRVKGTNYILSQLNNKRIIIFDFKTKEIHFMSNPLNNYVYQFKIDYSQQKFFAGQYSTTENIYYYDLILERPYLVFRSERGVIAKASLFHLQGEYLVLQHDDNTFWTVDLQREQYQSILFYNHTIANKNEKLSYFVREGLFTLITTSGKVYKFPYFNSQIVGPPQILDSPCPDCSFDEKITIRNTTINNIFVVYDSVQFVLYNSEKNNMLWYKKFSDEIVYTQIFMNPCQIYIGLQNRDIQAWNCEDTNNVYVEYKVTSTEDIISFHRSVENSQNVYVVSKLKIIFYKMQQVNRYGILNEFIEIIKGNQPEMPTAETVFEATDFFIIKSEYLPNLRTQVILTSERNTEDKKKIIISTSQKVWFINIWPLYQQFDFSSKILDFHKDIKILEPTKQLPISQYSPFQNESKKGKFNNACLLNIYFTASSESRQMSVFGQGTQNEPFSHFSAVQSLLIQVGLNNLIFNYRENQINLRFFSNEPNLSHKISKRVTLQNSSFTIIKYIGEQNTLDGKTIIEIEGGYELNNYMSVFFENIIFKTIDTNYETTVTKTNTDQGIKQFSVLNIQNVVFDRTHFGLQSSSSPDIQKYISVSNCTKLNITKSEFQATSFLIDNLANFFAEDTSIIGVKSDLTANNKQKANLLNKRGMVFIKQVLLNKFVESNRMILNKISLKNCKINSVKLFALECKDSYQFNVKAPSILLNQTYLQHSSIFGLSPCRYLQEQIMRIDLVTLIDLEYKDSQILTDGLVSISRISKIVILNTQLQQKNNGSEASLLSQYSGIDTEIDILQLNNLYLSDTILFKITNNFSIMNVTVTNCKLAYSYIFQVQSQSSEIKVSFQNISIMNSDFQYSSKVVDILNTLALRVDINQLLLKSVNVSSSSLVQAQQDKSQIAMNISNILLNQCRFQNSRLIEKGSQVFVNINDMRVTNNTQFENSIVLKSTLNLESQNVNLLNIPIFNLIDLLEISNSNFNQSKILEIKEQAQFFIHRLNFTFNSFTAQIQEQFAEVYSEIMESYSDNIQVNEEEVSFNKKNFQERSFTKSDTPSLPSDQNRIRYLLEVTNLRIYNISIIYNQFSGYILSGQPQTQSAQSEISQQYDNLNLSHNTFIPQSNFIFFEINFNSLNKNSQVFVSNFTLVNNTVDSLNPAIPLSQLEDGRTFYFFGSDKLGKINFNNGVIKDNENIGFVNIKFSLDSISITNVNATGKQNSFIQYQPFIQILHPRRFVMQDCNFLSIGILGSNLINIELNRQYFLIENKDKDLTQINNNEGVVPENKIQVMQQRNVELNTSENTNCDLIKILLNQSSQENSNEKDGQYKQFVNNDSLFQNEYRKLNNFNRRKKYFNYTQYKMYYNSTSQSKYNYNNQQERQMLQQDIFGEPIIENLKNNNFSSFFQSQNYFDDEDYIIPQQDSDEDDNSKASPEDNADAYEQFKENYYVIVYKTTFKEILGLNISSSVTSSVINVQSGLIINVFIEDCIFQENLVQANENYSRQRRLSQVEIMAINANIFMSFNTFLYGRFELPYSFTIDTVYFHLLAKNILFSNTVKSHNFFKGECSDSDQSNFMSGGIIEGKNIRIEGSKFSGTCTLSQPTIYIKLFDRSELKIAHSNFTDLYAQHQGAGLVVNGVQNRVKIIIENITIDRMYSPSTDSEGFFLFNNLKEGSIVNITNIFASRLYTQNGSFLKSLNNQIFIILQSVYINNFFDNKILEEYLELQTQISQLNKKVSDQTNNTDYNYFYPDQYDNDEFENILFGQRNRNLINTPNQIRLKEINNQIEQEENNDYISINSYQEQDFDQIDLDELIALQIKFDNKKEQLKHLDGGMAIQINNAQLFIVKNLTIINYGLVQNKNCEMILVDKVENVYLNELNLKNNTFFYTNAIKIANSKLILKDSIFQNNSFGGPSLVFINSLETIKNQVKNVKFVNNVCFNSISCYSTLFVQLSVLHMKDIYVAQNRGNNTVGGMYYSLSSFGTKTNNINSRSKQVQESQQAEVIFDGIVIENNIGLIGGFVLELGKDIIAYVINSHFIKNEGTQIGGVSLQIFDSNSILFVNSTITDNISKFIGGLCIQKSSTIQLRDYNSIFIKNNIPNQITSGPRSFELIQFNDSSILSSQANYILTEQLADRQTIETTIRSYNYIKNNEKEYEVFDFNSGDQLPSFYLKIFDENKNIIIRDIIPTVKLNLSPETQSKKGSFLKGNDGKTGSFTQQNKTQYDPQVGLLFEQLQLYGMPGSIVTIIFKLADINYENSESLIPFNSSSQYYNFKINVYMRKCIVGEQIKNNLMTTECEECSKQYYSLLDPHIYQNVKCLKCPDNVSCPGSNTLILNQGFWRSSMESDVIIQCQFSSENCLGGSEVGDKSCMNSRVGPLCETCDIKKGYTDLSTNQCLNCSHTWQGALIIASILVFFVFYIFISIDSTVSRIKKFRILFEYSSANHIGQTSMLVKQFVSYLQVLSIISYFRFNFGKESISSIIYTIGNPLIGFNNVVSCFIYQFANAINLPHIYASFTLSIIIPISLSLVVLIVQMIFNFRNYYYRKYYLSTMMLVNYFYFTPLVLARTMELMTCHKIGDKEYISASLMYSCGTSISTKMNLFYLLPLLVILILVIPIWIIYRIRVRYIQKLPLKYFQYILGDFRKKFFYWEFVRFFTKIALVSLPIVFQEDIRTMGQVLNLILILYYASVLYFHPFWTQICQRMELITGAALFITFHFCLLSYNKESYSVWWWVTIILIALANVPLIAWYIISFFQAYKPTLNRFFNQNPRRKMSDSDDPQARASLLWQLALYTVQKHIKKEKMQQQADIKNASQKVNLSQLDNSSFATRYTLSGSKSEHKKRSRLLWWRNSGIGQSNGDSQIKRAINEPLISNNQITTNTAYHQHNHHQISQSSDDYNPYHDFNFSFLPQENNMHNQNQNYQ